ncbi:MAG: hypothetical protein HWN66_03755 [Candidatus Helarchaeota archaeon]|nr:hypothetical protein [Candidatus Helarchaeota archaeon]
MPKSKSKAKVKDLKSCIICEREIHSENYCKYHVVAFQNVMQNYDDWKEGYGELTFLEYLQKIIENSATGIWAKEVAEKLLEKEKLKK